MKKTHNFRELKIWQLAMDLVKEVYLVSAQLPPDERFGFISQLNRCALSVPSNIAEGSGRTSEKEFIHFLRVAISSSYELETQLLLAKDLFQVEATELIDKLTTLQNMIGAFIRKLTNEIITGSDTGLSALKS